MTTESRNQHYFRISSYPADPTWVHHLSQWHSLEPKDPVLSSMEHLVSFILGFLQFRFPQSLLNFQDFDIVQNSVRSFCRIYLNLSQLRVSSWVASVYASLVGISPKRGSAGLWCTVSCHHVWIMWFRFCLSVLPSAERLFPLLFTVSFMTKEYFVEGLCKMSSPNKTLIYLLMYIQIDGILFYLMG